MEAGQRLSGAYERDVAWMQQTLHTDRNFDVICRRLAVGQDEVALFYIDGFVKDGECQRIMQYLVGRPGLAGAEETARLLPYVEVERTSSAPLLVTAVLAGQTALLGSRFGGEAILMDLRTYPARPTQEPESDKVMQGARDGFVETLVMNTALLRRRVRDPRLTMRHFNLGGASAPDVVVCYMEGVADGDYVERVCRAIREARPRSLTLGFQSLAESLIRTHWYNPFPKIRTTERPDAAAAQVLEGSVLVFCDTSPQVMLLPTSILDYLQQTDDYYFPPLTGSYLRLIRALILLLSLVCTPLWYLYLEYAALLPASLSFLIPDAPGAIPIFWQLVLCELAIDGLKIASMNTPDMLSNSLSVVGALILGDFAIGVGWFCQDVILYMAFVAIANFAQQNHELGHAFKFMRLLLLVLTAVLKLPGFLLGLLLCLLAVATNRTVTGSRRYLYPLIPFDGRALCHLLFRLRKRDFAPPPSAGGEPPER